MDKARRRRVPAFGEWNYYSYSSSSSSPDEPHYSGAAVGAECWWYAPEPDACSDAWFMYSPPPRRRPPPQPKKARRPETAGAAGAAAVVVVVDAASPWENKKASAAVSAPAKGARRRVVGVRPVDEDLYRVPPPDDSAVSRHLPRRARKRAARRSSWMGCLGLNCVA